MGSLSGQEDRDANWTVGMLGTLRWKGGYSEKDIATKLHFDTVEDIRTQLQKWELPDWLARNQKPTRLRKLGKRVITAHGTLPQSTNFRPLVMLQNSSRSDWKHCSKARSYLDT